MEQLVYIIELKRTYTNLATFGTYNLDGDVYYTIEPPDLVNIRNKSCIYAGIYEIKTGLRSNGSKCLRLLNVYERSEILIHTGNTVKDTKGCIIVGLSINNSVLKDSKIAVERLYNLVMRNKNKGIKSFIHIKN